jgi:hypothetical protein
MLLRWTLCSGRITERWRICLSSAASIGAHPANRISLRISGQTSPNSIQPHHLSLYRPTKSPPSRSSKRISVPPPRRAPHRHQCFGLGLRVHTTAFGMTTFFPADTRGVTIRDVNTGVGRTPFGVGAADRAASSAARAMSSGTSSPRTRQAAAIMAGVIFMAELSRPSRLPRSVRARLSGPRRPFRPGRLRPAAPRSGKRNPLQS